jgi:hypothetical protein
MLYFNCYEFSHKSDCNFIIAITNSFATLVCYGNIRHMVDVCCPVCGRPRSQSDLYVNVWINCKLICLYLYTNIFIRRGSLVVRVKNVSKIRRLIYIF